MNHSQIIYEGVGVGGAGPTHKYVIPLLGLLRGGPCKLFFFCEGMCPSLLDGRINLTSFPPLFLCFWVRLVQTELNAKCVQKSLELSGFLSVFKHLSVLVQC